MILLFLIYHQNLSQIQGQTTETNDHTRVLK